MIYRVYSAMHTCGGELYPLLLGRSIPKTNVDMEEETKAGCSPHLLSFWIGGLTWGCHGFQNPRVGAAAGPGGVRAGAESGGGGEGFLGRALWFLHLLRAQVDFDGPLRAIQM